MANVHTSLKMLCGAALTLSLAACGAAKVPLEGERIDVLVEETRLVPDTDVYSTQLFLPKPLAIKTWTQVGGFAHHRPTHVDIPDTVTQAWAHSIGCGSAKTSIPLNPPILYGESVFAMNTCGAVYALNAGNGKVLWSRKMRLEENDLKSFSGGIAANDSTLYVTTGGGEVYALDSQNGKQKWVNNLKMPLRAAPTLFEDFVYVVSHNNRLFALDAATGAVKWTHSGLEEALALMGGATPAVDENVVVVPYSSGEIYALDAKTGRYLWHNAMSLDNSLSPLANLIDFEASPVIASGMVYAVNHNGWLTVFDLKTGQRYWERRLSAEQMPWVAGNAIFVVTSDNKLVALNRADGRIRWIQELNPLLKEKDAEGLQYWSGPLLAGGRLFVVSNTGYAIALDPATGKAVRRSKLAGGVGVAPIAAARTLYFMTNTAQILAYR